jgi:hypothetical protein
VDSMDSWWKVWIPPGFHPDATWKWSIFWLGRLQRKFHMDSMWTTWNPWIPCEFHLESMGEGKVLQTCPLTPPLSHRWTLHGYQTDLGSSCSSGPACRNSGRRHPKMISFGQRRYPSALGVGILWACLKGRGAGMMLRPIGVPRGRDEMEGGRRDKDMKASLVALFWSTVQAMSYQLWGLVSDGLPTPIVATAFWICGFSPLWNLTTMVLGSV